MIEKQIDFNSDARGKLIAGIDKLADAVKTTLGAAGNTVILEDELGRPHITKDGVTVAKSINLTDPVEHLGASVLRQASIKTANEAGDGTTTSVVMAQRMIQRAFSFLENKPNLNKTKFRNELEAASKIVLEELTKKSREVTSENLVDVATISANNDRELGEIIADAYNKVGVDGAVTIEQSMSDVTYTDIVEGTRIKKGFHSPYMITDKEKNQAILEKPLVFISDKKVNTIEDIEFVLQAAMAQKRSVLLVADIDTPVMNTLNVNKARGVISINVVTPEGVGTNRFELLEDLAVMTGGKVVSDETGTDFSGITVEFLGSAKKAVSTERETIITLDTTDLDLLHTIAERAKTVRSLISSNKDKPNNWHHKDRLSRLSGGIASIHVGARTEVEMKEKKDRVEDAIWATRSALEEGIVAGGGIALLNASQKLTTMLNSTKSEEESAALHTLILGLNAPVLQILENASYDRNEFYEKLSKVRRRGYGLDVKSSKFGNMFDMGIIDPLKVSKNVVMNSVSVVITLLTTNCVVSNKRI